MEEGKLRIQDYLSFGYIYLVTLGILRDSIYYGFLGINIMSYSNILDVLLSPIAYLSRHPGISVSFLLFFFWLLLQPRLHKKYRDQKWYQKIFNVEKRDKVYVDSDILPKEIVSAILIFFTSFFIGTGLGGGSKKVGKIKKEQLELSNVLHFSDNTQSKVSILGQNSNYIFYVKEGAKTVSISPINGNVKSIEKIED